MMRLNIKRETATALSTPGQYYINGGWFSYTLERSPNDPDHPCIPAGEYPMTLEPTHNPHLWTPYGGPTDGKQVDSSCPLYRCLPRINNVPNRTGILDHAGNKALDSIGCVLHGYQRVDADHIAQSRAAVKALVDKMHDDGGPWVVTVEDAA